MKFWKITDRGMVRNENQDSFDTREIGSFHVAVVCDGMGGAKAGMTASRMVVACFMESLSLFLKDDMDADEVVKTGLAAVERANSAVFGQSLADEACRGMGSTLVAVISRGDRAVVFNVGDSRAYRINSTDIQLITRDHSLVQDMLEHGDITAEEARSHPNRNLITRAMGTEPTVLCDTFPHKWEEGDYIFLCSDGLSNTVTDQEILYEVIHEGDIDQCLDRLLKISLGRGASDNVTMILMKYEKEANA